MAYEIYDINTMYLKTHEYVGNSVLVEEIENDDKVIIPLVLVFGSFIGYILFTGFVFMSLEDNWTYVQSIYFAYISIATIGNQMCFFYTVNDN